MSNQTDPNNGELPKEFFDAVNKLLRSFVRLLLSFRIAFPKTAELLKQAYVDVAEKEFMIDNKPQTDARLSLLTGIHRKDIKRLRNKAGEKEETSDASDAISSGVRLVARWLSEPKYQSDTGEPLPLPLKAKAGEPSFEALVKDVLKQDIRPRVILDDWLNQGVVSMSESKVITLNTEAFVPSNGLGEKAFFFGHSLADHLAAGTHNLLGKEPALFDRIAYYDGLSRESIEVIEELAKKRGTDTLRELNELAMSLKMKDMAKKQNKHRLNIGLFVYHEPEESEK